MSIVLPPLDVCFIWRLIVDRTTDLSTYLVAESIISYEKDVFSFGREPYLPSPYCWLVAQFLGYIENISFKNSNVFRFYELGSLVESRKVLPNIPENKNRRSNDSASFPIHSNCRTHTYTS